MALSVVVAFDREASQVLARHEPGHPALANAAELEAVADAQDVAEALRATGHRVSLLPLGRDALKSLAALESAPPDLVFNLCDTLCAQGSLALLVPATLELLGIAFTGASAVGLGLSKRKQDVKSALERAGLPTPRYQVIGQETELATFELALEPPLMVKPTHEHASIGIELGSICFDASEVRARARLLFQRLAGGVLVEEYVAGREVYVSFAGCPTKSLGLMEYGFSSLPEGLPAIRTFERKWFGRDAASTPSPARNYTDVPARTPSVPSTCALEDLEASCHRAFALGGGRDWGRVDVRVDARTRAPLIIDVTPNTYLSASSPCAKAALAMGMPFTELISGIARSALQRGRS